MDLAGCLREGRDSAEAALAELGLASGDSAPLPDVQLAETTPGLVLWRVPGREQDQFVDVQRDATVADVARAVGAGMRSVEHIKRYTTIGTAHDQGKTSGVIASGITAELLGLPIEALGTTTFRPPYTPGRVRRAGRARPWRAVRPGAHHGAARLARRAGRGVRGRRAVEAAAVLPAARARTWTPRCCANARRRAAVSASSTAPRSARSTCQGRDAAELLDRHLHQPHEQPEGRLDPVRRDVRRRRHGDRRRHRAAAGRGPLPGLHHHRRRGEDPRLDGGVAADRVAAAAGGAAPR